MNNDCEEKTVISNMAKIRVLKGGKLGFKTFGWTRNGTDFRLHKFTGDKDYALFASRGAKTMFKRRLDSRGAKTLLKQVRKAR